jgi:hypothetical protein
MMQFFAEHYGKRYAENTRETIRRSTLHQFVDAGLVLRNPDNPSRPTNSGRTVYQVPREILELLRSYGSPEWERNLGGYLVSADTLRERYAQERRMARIPVTLPSGEELTLSGGGQNVLVEQIIQEFCPRWTPGGSVLYVGDTDEKFAYYERDALARIGVQLEDHGRMPDLIVHLPERAWLFLIEAVTTHGPVSPMRRDTLKTLFAGASADLVLVSAFLDRSALARYIRDIAFETEVWTADAPDHLIHFNGPRFLGPYERRDEDAH